MHGLWFGYVSEGKSHLIDFVVNDLGVGEKGSELRLTAPATIRATVKAAALLEETAGPRRGSLPWGIEQARVGQTREVPVEFIVNGQPVAHKNIVADGRLRDVTFDVKVERSSWVAIRILPSSHSNPVFVLVDGKPIRASKRSAEWCLNGVDQCWSQKERTYKPAELDDARAAYAHAREVYQRLLTECEVD